MQTFVCKYTGSDRKDQQQYVKHPMLQLHKGFLKCHPFLKNYLSLLLVVQKCFYTNHSQSKISLLDVESNFTRFYLKMKRVRTNDSANFLFSKISINGIVRSSLDQRQFLRCMDLASSLHLWYPMLVGALCCVCLILPSATPKLLWCS